MSAMFPTGFSVALFLLHKKMSVNVLLLMKFCYVSNVLFRGTLSVMQLNICKAARGLSSDTLSVMLIDVCYAFSCLFCWRNSVC